jgi:hypothetical protein
VLIQLSEQGVSQADIRQVDLVPLPYPGGPALRVELRPRE